jgi:hypothetical protein
MIMASSQLLAIDRDRDSKSSTKLCYCQHPILSLKLSIVEQTFLSVWIVIAETFE